MENFYPPSPIHVPEVLTQSTAAYRRQAWLALSGLAFFFILYCLFTSWFGWTAYKLFSSLGPDNKGRGMVLFGGVVCAFLAFFMIKPLFFIRRGGQAGLVEITPKEQPQLFTFLNHLADEIGAPRPHRVFLSPEVNAAVFYDLSLLSLVWPLKKNLKIGLGLVNALTLSEFKAICAHEFGHFAQKTMAVGQ